MKLLIILMSLMASLTIKAFTIGAYNIRNFDYDERARISTNKAELAIILGGLKADVLSVEEVNNTKEFELFLAAKLPHYAFKVSQCGGAHGQHLGFIYNKKTVELLGFNEDMRVTQPGTRGSCNTSSRPLAIGLFRIRSSGQKFYGMTAHLKAGSAPESMETRSKQFAIIHNIIEDLKARSPVKDFFLAGDLNTTEFLSRGSDFQILTKMVKSLGMVNLTQNAACSAYWWGGTEDGIETPSLLDHIVVTPGLVKTTVKAQVHGHCQKVSCRQVPIDALGASYKTVSDHCPITAIIQ